MGGEVSRLIAQQPSGGRRTKINIDSVYAEEYKRLSLDDVDTCLLRLTRGYGRHCMAINGLEFQQVFEGILTDPGGHFSIFDARGKGVIDILEVFSAAFLYSDAAQTSIDSKIEKLFALFDFDGSNRLNGVEAEIMVESLVRGASRVAMMPLPEELIDSAGNVSADLFHGIKQPLSTGAVTVQDVKKWVLEKEDVSSYLCRFTNARMIISSLELVERSIDRGIAMFMQAVVAQDVTGDGAAVAGEKVGGILRSLASVGRRRELPRSEREDKNLGSDVAAAIRMLIAGNPPGHERADLVHAEAFEEFLRCWVAFSVVDDEGLGCISVVDLKALLWLGTCRGGEEPSEASVQKTLNEIEESREGVVERMAWIRYSAALDEDRTRNPRGIEGEWLKVFRRHDYDRSGTITANELTMMIRDSVKDAVMEASPYVRSWKPGMEGVVETMVQDIARDLAVTMGGAGSGLVIGWTEFNKNKSLVATRLGTLRDFVLSAGLQKQHSETAEPEAVGGRSTNVASINHGKP